MSIRQSKNAHAVPGVDGEGLSADEIQLRAQGHVGELPRQFSPLSTLALAFSITNRCVIWFSSEVVTMTES